MSPKKNNAIKVYLGVSVVGEQLRFDVTRLNARDPHTGTGHLVPHGLRQTLHVKLGP